ncbi:MAG: flagellar basal body P-ring formation chaperone FlgA [Fretibacterium sp.]|nr:flagellar basal body P-ring formation chaperone FlgA [Fretibacterium sp.]
MKMMYALRRGGLRLFCILAALLAVIPGAFAAQRAAEVHITVPSVIYMQDAAFTLGEAARIEGPVQARAALSSLILSTSGGVLTRDEVLQALRASGLNDFRVELRMPVRVRVETPGPEGNGTETPDYRPQPSDTSLSAMVKSISAWNGDVEVTAVGSIPQGRLVEPASIVPGTPAATLRFQDDRGRVRSLSVRMTWTQNVLVAARTIQRDVPIRRRDLMTRSMKITRPGVYAVDPAEAVGHVSRKAVKQGEPIPLEFLTGPSQVKKGRKVTIVARYGGLTATADGVLLESGSPGDLVRVRRSDNRKAVVKGYIVDENTVEVRVQ